MRADARVRVRASAGSSRAASAAARCRRCRPPRRSTLREPVDLAVALADRRGTRRRRRRRRRPVPVARGHRRGSLGACVARRRRGSPRARARARLSAPRLARRARGELDRLEDLACSRCSGRGCRESASRISSRVGRGLRSSSARAEQDHARLCRSRTAARRMRSKASWTGCGAGRAVGEPLDRGDLAALARAARA